MQMLEKCASLGANSDQGKKDNAEKRGSDQGKAMGRCTGLDIPIVQVMGGHGQMAKRMLLGTDALSVWAVGQRVIAATGRGQASQACPQQCRVGLDVEGLNRPARVKGSRVCQQEKCRPSLLQGLKGISFCGARNPLPEEFRNPQVWPLARSPAAQPTVP